MELDAMKTMEEELVSIARARCQVGSMIVETGYGSSCHGWSTNDGRKGQSK